MHKMNATVIFHVSKFWERTPKGCRVKKKIISQTCFRSESSFHRHRWLEGKTQQAKLGNSEIKTCIKDVLPPPSNSGSRRFTTCIRYIFSFCTNTLILVLASEIESKRNMSKQYYINQNINFNSSYIQFSYRLSSLTLNYSNPGVDSARGHKMFDVIKIRLLRRIPEKKHALLYVIPYSQSFHDDVIKWKHFPRYWSFVRGIRSPVTDEFPSQRPVTRSFDVFFELRLKKWLSQPSRRRWFETLSRSLSRHCIAKLKVLGNISQLPSHRGSNSIFRFIVIPTTATISLQLFTRHDSTVCCHVMYVQTFIKIS